MKKLAIDDVRIENNPLQVHEQRRPVAQALNAEHVAMNHFVLEPGESFSGGVHTHLDQEEIFYIEAGRAEFEVGREGETVSIEAGEVIRFAPGEYQTGYVPTDAEERVVGWAIGAPESRHNWDDLRSIVPCRECGDDRPHITRLTDEGRFQFTCTDCETTFTL